jgi:hypothetical protein
LTAAGGWKLLQEHKKELIKEGFILENKEF